MVLRRTIFSSHHSRYADVYSHYKNILVSGHWAGDTNAKIVWTGSNNFTPDGTNFDEVMMRIRNATAYNQYARQWNYMKRRKSSAVYASFLEPIGGGRAPARAATTSTPTILSPDVTTGPDGQPRALD
jgi:phosphatidylserine/phosphatidylglycerophosphate/cardiolipin synthase-like enzyme